MIVNEEGDTFIHHPYKSGGANICVSFFLRFGASRTIINFDFIQLRFNRLLNEDKSLDNVQFGEFTSLCKLVNWAKRQRENKKILEKGRV